MNYIDLLLLVVVLFSAYTGYRKGFLLGTADLLTWAGSLIAALLLYNPAAEALERAGLAFGVWTLPIAFILIMILVRLVAGTALSFLLRQTAPSAHTHPVNRFGGLLPGVLSGTINAMIIAALLLVVPISNTLHQAAQESRGVNRLAEGVAWLDHRISPVFDPAIRRTVNNLTVKPDSQKSVELPFRVTNFRARPELEQEMLERVNKERAGVGLPPLKWDPELLPVARAHSADMFRRGYFSHVSPEGASAGDRIRKAGVRFLTAGENLALAPTLTLAHNGLMNSPGHRANILNKAYGRVGIGILDGGIRGLMVTQNFRN